MTDYFIGTDIGTGSVKSLALDRKGNVKATAQVQYPTLSGQQGRYEQEPSVILHAFVRSIVQIVDHMNGQPAGIGLSAAMHSVLFVDKNGEPISNLITWADNRAADAAIKLRSSAIGEMLYEQNGTPIHAMSPLCKLIWFREHDPAVIDRAFKILSIKEFIWLKLFGTYEADHSLASATGMMNINTLSWNENALTAAGIDNNKLSTLVSTSFLRNEMKTSIAREMKVDPLTPIVIGASDGCMANLGSFAIKPGIGALTIGTSGAIRVANTNPLYNFEAMTFNYRLDEETFICGGPTNNGGIVLKWYAENVLGKKLASADDYQRLLSPVKQVEPGCDGLIFLPYILGERAPIWNSSATGTFVGIRNHHTQAHFTRAVLEGISMALYSIASGMERCGLKIEQMNVSGGFIHSTEWLNIIANVFGKKLCVTSTGDASAMGAAYLGMKKTRMIDHYHEVQSKEMKELRPDSDIHQKYQRHFGRFQTLYKSITQNIEKE